MTRMTFPFETSFLRTIPAGTQSVAGTASHYPSRVDVFVREEVEVDIPELGRDSVEVVLEATDRTGFHRCIHVEDDGLYSIVVMGAGEDGRGGTHPTAGFSRFKPAHWRTNMIGSRILVEPPVTHGMTNWLDDLDERERRSLDRQKAHFAEQLSKARLVDGELYLPTPRIPVLCIRNDARGPVVWIDDPTSVKDGDTWGSARLGEMGIVLPWSMAAAVQFVDPEIRLTTCDATRLVDPDLDRDWYERMADEAAATIVFDAVANLQGKPTSYVRLYADAADAVEAGERSNAWFAIAKMTSSDPSPDRATPILAELGRMLTNLEPPGMLATSAYPRELLSDLLGELEDWRDALGGERPSLEETMDHAHGIVVHHPTENDVADAMRRLRAEATDWSDALNGERPGLTQLLVRVDHYLSSPEAAARRDVEPYSPLPVLGR